MAAGNKLPRMQSDGSLVKNPPAMQEMQAWSLGWKDPLEKEMTTHYSILAWKIPWTEEPGGVQSKGLQRVGHNWVRVVPWNHTNLSYSSRDQISKIKVSQDYIVSGSSRGESLLCSASRGHQHSLAYDPFYMSLSFQFSHSCLTPCDPMDCSTPGFPVLHQLSEFTPTHVRWVGGAIQPPHLLSSLSPSTFNNSQHQGLFKWVSSSHQVAKELEFQL